MSRDRRSSRNSCAFSALVEVDRCVLGDRYAFALLYAFEKRGEMRFRLERADGRHTTTFSWFTASWNERQIPGMDGGVVQTVKGRGILVGKT